MWQSSVIERANIVVVIVVIVVVVVVSDAINERTFFLFALFLPFLVLFLFLPLLILFALISRSLSLS